MNDTTDSEIFDVLIAGAGLSGVLMASRLKKERPEAKICLMEKEAEVGGRMRGSVPGKGLWSYGLNSISEELFCFWDQVLKEDPDGADLNSFGVRRQKLAGVLAAGKLGTIGISDFFSAKGARAIGGAAAARDWKNLEAAEVSLKEGRRKDQAFHSLWSGTKKSPAVIVLEQMAQLFGISDFWSASAAALFEKAKTFSQMRYLGDWESALISQIHSLLTQDGFVYQAGSQIIGARFDSDEKLWIISSRVGQVSAKKLIVAQPPWDALQWLPKLYWPTPLLQFAVKAKPISAVVLSDLIEETKTPLPEEIPDVVLIPAEGVQVLISPSGEVCYQVTIDYEISLQSPDVAKAVKRLKRAKKKLEASHEVLTGKADHLALITVAWTQPTAFNDKRFMSKLKAKGLLSEELLFCGDAYGASYDGDQNLIHSVQNAIALLTGAEVSEQDGAILDDDAENEKNLSTQEAEA